MKDRSHDDAMSELFKEDPAFAVELVNSILGDGNQEDLLIAFRQMDKAGLFRSARLLYDYAHGLLAALIAHHRRDRDVVVALRLVRKGLAPDDPSSIKAVIQKYGHEAMALPYVRAFL
jgi:hypothetical protein